MTNSSQCTSYPRHLAIPLKTGTFSSRPSSAMFMLEMNPEKSFSTDDGGTFDSNSKAIKRRFDKLPIHKICYSQSYQSSDVVLQKLIKAVTPTGRIRMLCNRTIISGMQQDCFGMTPLHILACSLKHDIKQYQLLIENYPESLITKDNWGSLPLLYTLWGNAPRAIVKLLVDSQKRFFPDYMVDFPDMIETIGREKYIPGRSSSSLESIKNVLNTQQSAFPDYHINWQHIITLWEAEDTKSRRDVSVQKFPHDTFQYLIHATILERLNLLSVKAWRQEILNDIDKLCWFVHYRKHSTRLIYSKLAHYEHLTTLREAMSVLELAAWKAKCDSSVPYNHDQEDKANTFDQKDLCRVKCGADVIMPNVLSFLVPARE